MEHLNSYISTVPAIAAKSHATGAMTNTAVTAIGGYDRARFVVILGAFGTAAEANFSVTQCATSNGAYTLIAGSATDQLVTTAANKVVVIDVPVSGSKPYLKLKGTAYTQTVLAGAICDLYKGSRALPPLTTALADYVVV